MGLGLRDQLGLGGRAKVIRGWGYAIAAWGVETEDLGAGFV